MNTNIKRGAWDEIVATSVDRETWLQIESLVKLAGSSADEHGSWHFGCAFDRKQRGEALNWDLYAFGNDLHDGRLQIGRAHV